MEEYRKADMAKIQGRIGLDDLWCGGKGEGLIMGRRLELSYSFKNPCSVLLLRIKKLIVEY